MVTSKNTQLNGVRVWPETPDFRITSHFQGLAYTVERVTDGAFVFLQNDDAHTFCTEMHLAERHSPEVLRNVCAAYEDVMSPAWYARIYPTVRAVVDITHPITYFVRIQIGMDGALEPITVFQFAARSCDAAKRIADAINAEFPE